MVIFSDRRTCWQFPEWGRRRSSSLHLTYTFPLQLQVWQTTQLLHFKLREADRSRRIANYGLLNHCLVEMLHKCGLEPRTDLTELCQSTHALKLNLI